ncbi:zinc-binding dehydrogenase [Pengzhenrongella frigida]|uniref:L-idonate 5-dehydrogenase n=1 Tax=Pengzhenrongella frigida TaxID=1259133 RepID=A0A4Q5N121_9MICO|nr:zinc-binding dehydrogenase [Cellulomonas sp. HLT2-17]RYV49711.1 L-idonate 5-dehydrogenase [Cellulomonas sp. HLT2-17]
MRAIVIHGKQDVREDEVATPVPGPDQVRVRMAYAGICGSDLHYYFEGANGAFVVREPLVPGHEVSGTVDLDPAGTYPPGTPVTVHPATFGRCEPGLEAHRHLWPDGAYLGSASTWPHTQGGMSEFLLVARDAIRVLPATLPLRRAALAEPLAVVLHAIAIAGGVAGKKVLVSGSGPIGLLAAAAALAHGAAEVVSTDMLAGPLRRAAALGVHRTVQVGQVGADELPTDYFDVALECSGAAPAINAAIAAVRRAGILTQVGMLGAGTHPIALAPLISKEIQLRGSFRFNDEIDEAVRLLDQLPWIEQVITHEVPAASATEAFATAKDSDRSGKVVVALWQPAVTA